MILAIDRKYLRLVDRGQLVAFRVQICEDGMDLPLDMERQEV